MDNLVLQRFDSFSHDDPFFDSLKSKYSEFPDWLNKKAYSGEDAYVLYNERGYIDGFMYLKIENDIDDIQPPLYIGKYLKVGTFKFNSKGTLRGQRFIKKAFDYAIQQGVDGIYVTVFETYTHLIDIFEKYGFKLHGKKETENGVERVYVRNMRVVEGDICADYPYVISRKRRKFLLSIRPVYHTRLFPDSKLITDSPDMVQDVSHTNSIHKIYISAARGVMELVPGDILVMYRTSDQEGKARYRAVVSSVCVVEEVKHINDFSSIEEFLRYCSRFTVFSREELIGFYRNKKYPFIIRFTYNIALPKRPIRDKIINVAGVPDGRWNLLRLSDEQFDNILRLGELNEGLVVY